MIPLLVADAVALAPALLVGGLSVFLTDDPANKAWAETAVLATWVVVPLIALNAALATVALLRPGPLVTVAAWITAIGPVLGLLEGVGVAVVLSRP